MPVAHFTREQFESTLPDKTHWLYCGVIDGEHTYEVKAYGRFVIRVRSSVRGEDGQSASSGEDSIRCWLLDPETNTPVAPKVARWITRVPGWEKRLLDTLRYLYKLASWITRCPTCNQWRTAKRVKKPGPNKGRVFLSCECNVPFTWLPDEFTKGKK